MKIFIVEKKDQTGVFLPIFPADIQKYLHDPSYLIWLDCPNPNYDWIKRTFKIRKQVIELCQNTKPTVFSKFLQKKLFLKTFYISSNQFPENTKVIQINFIISNGFILTTHSAPADCFEDLNYNFEELAKIFCKGTDTFSVYLLNNIMDKNLEFCGNFDKKIFSNIFDKNLELCFNDKTKSKKELADKELEKLNDSCPLILKKHSLIYKSITYEYIKILRRLIKQPPPIIKNVSSKRLLDELHLKTSAFYSELSRIDSFLDLITQKCSYNNIFELLSKDHKYLKNILWINFLILFMVIVLICVKNYPLCKITLAIILLIIIIFFISKYLYRYNKK